MKNNSYTNYYPFGMQMPGRNGSTGDYRYGFQGQEKDDELKGQGNSYTTMYRMYDSRLGRWKSVDPLAKRYTKLSPYQMVGNNPIHNFEKDGRYFTSYDTRYGGTFILNVTNYKWVEKATKATAIPFGIGLIFEASLASARAQDPSFDGVTEDFIGAALGFVGGKFIKLAKVKGVWAIIIKAGFEGSGALYSVLSDPQTFEIGVEYLAIKNLEKQGIGSFEENRMKNGEKGVPMTFGFRFNKEYIEELQKTILLDEELVNSEGFDLNAETQKRLGEVFELEKEVVKTKLDETSTEIAKEKASETKKTK